MAIRGAAELNKMSLRAGAIRSAASKSAIAASKSRRPTKAPARPALPRQPATPVEVSSLAVIACPV